MLQIQKTDHHYITNFKNSTIIGKKNYVPVKLNYFEIKLIYYSEKSLIIAHTYGLYIILCAAFARRRARRL